MQNTCSKRSKEILSMGEVSATQFQIAVMRKMIIIAHSLYIARRVNFLWKNNEK